MSSDPEPSNVLFEWYRRYIGTPDQETDVYAGFGLFFGGIAFAIVGIGLFLLSAAIGGGTEFVYALREVAAVAGAIGLPALLLGVTVLLPVDRRVMYAALGGTALCIVAVAWFTTVYPYNWNVPGPDASPQVVAVYAVGIVSVIAGTGAALVGHQVERVSETAPAAGEVTESSAKSTDDDETVTDEQVRRDIDAAMEGTDLSWGGVAKKKTKRLKLNTESVDNVDKSSLENAEAKTTRAAGDSVDDAVSGLRQLQGGEKKTASGTGVDDQTAALQELRKQQQAEEVAKADDEGFVGRLKDLL